MSSAVVSALPETPALLVFGGRACVSRALGQFIADETRPGALTPQQQGFLNSHLRMRRGNGDLSELLQRLKDVHPLTRFHMNGILYIMTTQRGLCLPNIFPAMDSSVFPRSLAAVRAQLSASRKKYLGLALESARPRMTVSVTSRPIPPRTEEEVVRKLTYGQALDDLCEALPL